MFANIAIASASAITTFIISRKTTNEKRSQSNAINNNHKTENNDDNQQERRTMIDFPPFSIEHEGDVTCKFCDDEIQKVKGYSPNNNNNKENNSFSHDNRSQQQAKMKKSDPLSKQKRERYLSWDDYFMTVAFLSSQRSKDPNKQVGAVIASEEKLILGVGYNGFPRGCGDDVLPWAKKSASDDPLETKYAYVCHAEMNAIMNKNSADVKNGTMYVTMYPCNECAKLMIQAGIREVVYCEGKLKNDDAKNEQEKNLLAARNSSSPTTSSSLETTPIKTVAILEEKKVDPSYHASERLLALAGIKVRKYEPKVKVDLTYVC